MTAWSLLESSQLLFPVSCHCLDRLCSPSNDLLSGTPLTFPFPWKGSYSIFPLLKPQTINITNIWRTLDRCMITSLTGLSQRTCIFNNCPNNICVYSCLRTSGPRDSSEGHTAIIPFFICWGRQSKVLPGPGRPFWFWEPKLERMKAPDNLLVGLARKSQTVQIVTHTL